MNEQRGEIMEFMTIDEFVNKSNIEIIQKLMEENNGYKLSFYYGSKGNDRKSF